MSALGRISEFFVEPASPRGGTSSGRDRLPRGAVAAAGPRAFAAPLPGAVAAPVERCVPARVAVVAPVSHVELLTCAAALVLARRRGSRRAVACVIGADGQAGRDAGRLRVVRLPADSEAAPAAARALGDAAPVVVGLSLRDAAFDGLLAEQDRVLIAPGCNEGPLARLAVEDTARAARATGRLDVPPVPPPLRALVLNGLAVPAPLRRAIERALDAPA